MKFSINWLQEIAQTKLSPQQIANHLTNLGIEVEGYHSDAVEGVVVGEILSIAQHPNADRLNICQVTDGKQQYSIVCGAHNVAQGQKVPMALVGAVLPEITITESTIRGEKSYGMICAAEELGLPDDGLGGIMQLAENAPLGADINQVLGLDDVVMEVDITPNRGDCWNILGLAREIGLHAGKTPKLPLIDAPIRSHKPSVALGKIQTPLYAICTLENIDITQPTPEYIKARLIASDQQLVNIVVDILNYIMLEIGQPMHAFDRAKINGSLSVRYAQKQESFISLDGQKVCLQPEHLIIADDSNPLALAGVIGSLDSVVSDTTQNIILEAAHFLPDVVRKRPIVLDTGSSRRFERGVDPELIVKAMDRACSLILQYCGGSASEIDYIGELPAVQPFEVRCEKIEKLLSLSLTQNRIANIAHTLGCQVEVITDDKLQITPPSWRFDLNIEQDIAEECARIEGLDSIEPKPLSIPMRFGNNLSQSQKDIPRLRSALATLGWQECITYSFVNQQMDKAFGAKDSLKLKNPMSLDATTMRSSLLTGLLQTLTCNYHRTQHSLRLFEIGQCFYGDSYKQRLALMAHSNQTPSRKSQPLGFHDIKALALKFAPNATIRPTNADFLNKGKAADLYINEQCIGYFGVLYPKITGDLTQDVVVLEMDISAAAPVAITPHIPLEYQPIMRDFSVVIDEAITIDKLTQSIQSATQATVHIFDIYRAESIGENKKSIAFSLLWQPEANVVQSEIDNWGKKVLECLEKDVGAQIR